MGQKRPRTMIVFGATRMVVLYQDKAYKIMRIKPLSVIKHSYLRLRQERPMVRRSTGERMTLLRALSRAVEMAFLDGWHANRREVRRWYGTESQDLLPVLYYLFGGVMVVMPRVEMLKDVPEGFLRRASLDSDVGDYDDRPSNKGLYRGEEVWVDYGYPEHPVDDSLH